MNNSTVEQLESLLLEEKSDAEKAELFLQLGKAYNASGKLQEAIAATNQALLLFERSANTAQVIRTGITAGNIYINLGNLSEAFQSFYEALRKAKAVGTKADMISAYNGLGNVRGTEDKLTDAISYYETALKLAAEIKDIKMQGSLVTNLGVIRQKQGNYSESLKNYLEALRYWQQTDNYHFEQITLLNIAVVYQHLEQLPDALKYYEMARALTSKVNNPYLHSRAVLGVGDALYTMKSLEAAKEHYTNAMLLNKEIGDKQGIAYSYSRLGLIATEEADWGPALELCLQSANLFKELGMAAGEAEAYRHIAQIYSKQHRYESALEYTSRAVGIAMATGSKGTAAIFYKDLYLIHKAAGNSAAALSHFEKHVELQNEVRNVESNKQIADLKSSYDLELKEKEKILIEKILHNILPKSIADKIKNGEEKIIQRFDNASVLFADMVGFTVWSQKRNVNEVAETLNHIFNLFDELATEHGVEKIKTIGDAYMCVAGLPEPCEDHAERMAKMALTMNQKISEAYPSGEIRLRIGIHCGEVIAGVIGKNKYAYDLWGDTVNTASRMESHGVENKIQVSEEFRNLVLDKFPFEERGEIEVKGKGKMKTWWLVS